MISGRVTAKPIASSARNYCAAERNIRRRIRQRDLARLLADGRGEAAALLTEFRARIIHRAERAAQFLLQVGRVPTLRVD